jgi:uncharacterized OB-fold protein
VTAADSNDLTARPQPQPDPDSAGFWDATAMGRLAICRCTECRLWMQPPLERCRRCAGPVEFAQVSGTGTLYSWITVNRQSVPGPEVPYHIGVIELDVQPGIRLAGIIEETDPASLRVGMDVRVDLRPLPGGDFVAPVIVVPRG